MAAAPRPQTEVSRNVFSSTHSVGVRNLRCGHQTNVLPLVTGQRKLWLCPTCRQLVEAR